MKSNLKSNLGILIATGALLAGCNNGQGNSGQTPAQIFVSNLNSYDPGNTYTLAKSTTQRGGGFIVIQVDGGAYYAMDINPDNGADSKQDYNDFQAERISVTPVGGGNYKDSSGNLYEHKEISSMDLESVGAKLDKIRVNQIGSTLSKKYGICADRSAKIAQLYVDMKAASVKRGLTRQDDEVAVRELTSAQLNEIEAAIKSGDQKQLDSYIDKAAAQNCTTRAHIQEVVQLLQSQ